MTSLPITLREPRVGEWPFVYAGWIRSCIRLPPARVYHDDQGRIRTRYLDDGWAEVLAKRIDRLRPLVKVAEAEQSLVGFVCASPKALHFLYVEGRFRRRRVATSMLMAVAPEAKSATHWTPDLAKLRPAMLWDETALEERDAAQEG